MSPTLRITRSRARREVLEALLSDDRVLEGFLDSVLEPRLYNCVIVDDHDTNNDDEVL